MYYASRGGMAGALVTKLFFMFPAHWEWVECTFIALLVFVHWRDPVSQRNSVCYHLKLFNGQCPVVMLVDFNCIRRLCLEWGSVYMKVCSIGTGLLIIIIIIIITSSWGVIAAQEKHKVRIQNVRRRMQRPTAHEEGRRRGRLTETVIRGRPTIWVGGIMGETPKNQQQRQRWRTLENVVRIRILWARPGWVGNAIEVNDKNQSIPRTQTRSEATKNECAVHNLSFVRIYLGVELRTEAVIINPGKWFNYNIRQDLKRRDAEVRHIPQIKWDNFNLKASVPWLRRGNK